jgi:hypothetical protein
VLLPFQPADVGLAAGGQEELSYAAGGKSLELGRGEDLVDGTARFNPFTPAVQTGQREVRHRCGRRGRHSVSARRPGPAGASRRDGALVLSSS